MRPVRYEQTYPDEWISPVHRGYRMKCCHCGLVHSIDFKVVREGKRNVVMYRARQDKRATAAGRRKRK